VSVFGVLLGQRLRRDRWQLSIWIASVAALTLFSAAAINTTYDTTATRIGILKLAATDPSILAVRGAAQGSSAGAMLAFEVLGFITVLACLMSTFLAVRHSRAEEETGRAELIASTRAGRIAPTVATLAEGAIANAAVAAVVFLALIATGLPALGSIVFGVGVGGAGLAFVAIGLTTSQIFSTPRAANGWAAALVGLAYLLRAVGDSSGTLHANGYVVTSAWPSWLSPIGWAQLASPYVADDAVPILLDLALAAVLVAATLALQTVRDSGAGLIAERSGRRSASPALSGPIGLAWRLQRGSIIGWGVGALAAAALAGSLGTSAVESLTRDSTVGSVIGSLVPGGTGALTRVFIAAMMGIVGLIVAGCRRRAAEPAVRDARAFQGLLHPRHRSGRGLVPQSWGQIPARCDRRKRRHRPRCGRALDRRIRVRGIRVHRIRGRRRLPARNRAWPRQHQAAPRRGLTAHFAHDNRRNPHVTRVNIGVIGTGSIAQLHLDAYAKNPEVDLVAVSDLNLDRAQSVADKYGARRAYADPNELLADPEVDAVSICTWNDSHARWAIAAIAAGKHVLVEKPMSRTYAEALEVQQAVDASDRILHVGFVRRHSPNAEVLKTFIDNGELGDIYYARASVIRRVGNPGGWFANKTISGGGPLIDVGVHVVDLCWYLMGSPRAIAVSANAYHHLGNRANITTTPRYKVSDYDPNTNTVEDMVNALVRFENGASMLVEASYSLLAT
jgi:predicted dehydrogenase